MEDEIIATPPNTQDALITMLPQIYEDLPRPTVKLIGQTLEQVFGIILKPTGEAARILTDTMLRAIKKMENEGIENIERPRPRIAVPIIREMTYNTEEELREALAEMLKNSCLKGQKDKVSPAYVHILSQLSPDEVRILEFLHKQKNTYQVNIEDFADVKAYMERTGERLVDQKGNTPNISMAIRGIPFVEIKSTLANEWRVVEKYFNDIENRVALEHPENTTIYLENMRAIGIMELEVNKWFAPVTIYQEIEEKARRTHQKRIKEEYRNIKITKGRADITERGKSFLNACMPK